MAAAQGRRDGVAPATINMGRDPTLIQGEGARRALPVQPTVTAAAYHQ
jgi:hypothetical protein